MKAPLSKSGVPKGTESSNLSLSANLEDVDWNYMPKQKAGLSGGFVPIFIVVILVALIAGGVFFLNQRRQPEQQTVRQTESLAQEPAEQKCSGDYVNFTSDFVDKAKTELIVPPGGTGSGKNLIGTEFKTHSFVQVKADSAIYAPVDMKLIQGSHYIEEGMNQYLLIFESGCIRVLLDHILKPVDSIKNVFPKEASVNIDELQHSGSQSAGLDAAYASSKVDFKAGDLLGTTNGTKLAHRFDFGVYNFGKKSFLAQEPNYQNQWRYAYADCPYDYYQNEKRSFYYSLFASANSQDPIPKNFCKQ